MRRLSNVVLEQLIPKERIQSITFNIQRILQPVTDFIRGNPLVSTAAIGAGVTGLVAAVATVRRVRKKRRVIKRRKKVDGRRRKPTRRRKVGRPRRLKGRITHRSPRHKGHKKVMFTTAGGKRVSFLVRKKGGVKHKRRKKR